MQTKKNSPTLYSNLVKLILGHMNIGGAKKYARNTGWTFFARITMISVSLFSTIIVARTLGPTSYGELSYAISFVALFSIITSLGIDGVLYRDLLSRPGDKNKILGTALFIKLAASGAGFFICIIMATVLSPDDVSRWLIIILAASFLFQTLIIVNTEFQAAVQAKWISLLAICVSVTTNLLKILCVSLGFGVIYLAIIITLESILYAVGYLCLRNYFFGTVRAWRIDFETGKKMLSDSWPFIFSSAFIIIYTRIDQVMLKNIIDATTVGMYDAAVRISEVWYFIPSILVSSLFPALMNAKLTNSTEYRFRIKKIIFLLSVISVVVTVFIYIFANLIVTTIYGETFTETSAILRVYIWAFIPFAFITLLQHILLAHNMRALIFISAFIGMVVNIALNLVLIPLYGGIGAAIATTISSTIVLLSIIIVIYMIKYYRIFQN